MIESAVFGVYDFPCVHLLGHVCAKPRQVTEIIMKRIATSFVLLASVVGASSANVLGVPGRDYVANEILVKYRAGRSSTISRLGLPGRVVGTIPQLNVARVRLLPGMTVERAIRSINRSGNFAYAEPNYKDSLFQRNPNDTRYSEQYHLPRVELPMAWARTLGSATVKVAIIDTGINKTHEDLTSIIAPGERDFSDNDNDTTDIDGHGTHCAGIAGAATNNALGVAGAGWGIRILPLKIFPNSFANVSAAAIVYAADQGCKVISMSFGGPFDSQVRQDAINYAWNRGSLMLAAAGNDGMDGQNYPAANERVIAVGATNAQDRKTGFSTHGNWVDIAAPGSGILATYVGGNAAYEFLDGTSMSCPLAAGVAALLFSFSPTSTNADVRRALETSTDPVVGNNPATGQPWFAHGRINANRALDTLRPPIAFEDAPDRVAVFVNGTAEGTAPSGFVDGTTFAPSVAAADGSAFTVGSVGVKGVGQVSSVQARIPLLEPASTVIGGNIRITGTTTSLNTTTVLVYLRNHSTNRLDRIGSTVLNGSTQLVALPTDMSPYADSLNNVTVIVRSILPQRIARSPYGASFDEIVLEGAAVN